MHLFYFVSTLIWTLQKYDILFSDFNNCIFVIGKTIYDFVPRRTFRNQNLKFIFLYRNICSTNSSRHW